MIKIAIIDDHSVVRSGLREFLESHPDLQVVGEGASGRDALALTRRHSVDVLLMDLCMPGQNGVDALADVLMHSPGVRVLILSGYPEALYAINLMRQGAMGFLNKNCELEDIVKAVRTIAAGRPFVPERPPRASLAGRGAVSRPL